MHLDAFQNCFSGCQWIEWFLPTIKIDFGDGLRHWVYHITAKCDRKSRFGFLPPTVAFSCKHSFHPRGCQPGESWMYCRCRASKLGQPELRGTNFWNCKCGDAVYDWEEGAWVYILMQIHVHVHMHIHIYIYIYLFLHLHIHIQITYTYAYTYIYMCTYIYIHILSLNSNSLLYPFIALSVRVAIVRQNHISYQLQAASRSLTPSVLPSKLRESSKFGLTKNRWIEKWGRPQQGGVENITA